MKNITKILILAQILVAGAFGFGSKAAAYSPSLSASRSGDGVYLTISGGAPSAHFIISYVVPGSVIPQTLDYPNFNTDYNGNFSSLLGGMGTSFVSGTQIYAVFNNQDRTPSVALDGGYSGCSYYGCNIGGLSFSQASVSLNVGQSAYVSISSGVNMSVYPPEIASNSNSNIAWAGVSGTQLTITGQAAGSTTIRICLRGGSTCGDVYVTVSANAVGNWSLSQTNVTVNAGQTATVNAYFPYVFSGNLSVGSNGNPSVATVGFSGSTIYVYGHNAGSANISICYSGQCNNLYVTVSGSSGTLSLSQSSVTINQGQNLVVTVYDTYSSSGLYVSANNNPQAVTPTLSGNSLNLYGKAPGFSTVTVCRNSPYVCASVNVTVNSGSYSQDLYFTTTSLPQLTVGQYYNHQLQVSGGSAPYVFTLASGQLPAGLSLSLGGHIFGTPQNSNSASFTVRVTDNFGRSAQMAFSVTPGSVQGASSYNNGVLLNENGTIYIVYKNSKTGFASAAAFLGLGFEFSDAVSVVSGIPYSGYTVTTASAAHPWGSWVKSGQTVYFVHELGLIPITDYNIFLSNGGSDNLVVAANSYDFQLPILSVMVTNDTRLK